VTLGPAPKKMSVRWRDGSYGVNEQTAVNAPDTKTRIYLPVSPV